MALGISLWVLHSKVEADDICKGISKPDPESCPIYCLINDPVCGADGYTYWCGCVEAMCAETQVVRSGQC
ncbi:unnamed protein product [Linum trigynum]